MVCSAARRRRWRSSSWEGFWSGLRDSFIGSVFIDDSGQKDSRATFEIWFLTFSNNCERWKHQQPHQKHHNNKKQPPQSHYLENNISNSKKNTNTTRVFFGAFLVPSFWVGFAYPFMTPCHQWQTSSLRALKLWDFGRGGGRFLVVGDTPRRKEATGDTGDTGTWRWRNLPRFGWNFRTQWTQWTHWTWIQWIWGWWSRGICGMDVSHMFGTDPTAKISMFDLAKESMTTEKVHTSIAWNASHPWSLWRLSIDIYFRKSICLFQYHLRYTWIS